MVPAKSLTMARVSPKRAFNREDLPTLGRPIIATRGSFFADLYLRMGLEEGFGIDDEVEDDSEDDVETIDKTVHLSFVLVVGAIPVKADVS